METRTYRYIFLKNIRKILKNFVKKKKNILSVVDENENSAKYSKKWFDTYFINNDINNRDILILLWKCCKHLVIEDNIDDKKHSNHQSELCIWKEEANELKIWNYEDHKNGNFKSARWKQKKWWAGESEIIDGTLLSRVTVDELASLPTENDIDRARRKWRRSHRLDRSMFFQSLRASSSVVFFARISIRQF